MGATELGAETLTWLISIPLPQGRGAENEMQSYRLVIAILFALLLPVSAVATKRCPADDMGCTQGNYEQKVKDRIEQGKKEVREARGPVKKANAAGRTVRDCADCGIKVIKDSIGGSVSK